MIPWKTRVLAVVFLALSCAGLRAQVPGEGWERIGLLAGNVTAIGVSPSYDADKTLYVGLSGGGLWRSVDRGDTWTVLTSVPTTATVTAIAFDPRYQLGGGYPVYAGTSNGWVYASFDDFGTVNSDRRRQFTAAVNGAVLPINALAVPPAGGYVNFLFVATRGGGIYYNYNFGWAPGYLSASNQGAQADARALATGPSGKLLAAVINVDGGPVYEYSGPNEWIYRGPSGMVNLVPTGLALSPSGAQVFLTVMQRGMWRSSDGAVSWTPACDGSTVNNGLSLPTAVATCPNFASDAEVWEGRYNGLYTSIDGGQSCTPTAPASWVNAIAFAPGYHLSGGLCDAFVGTNVALYRKSCGPAPRPVPATPPAVSVRSLAVAQGALPGTWAACATGLYRNSRLSYTGNPEFLQYNASGAGFGGAPDLVAVRLAPAYTRDGSCGTDQATLVVADRGQGVFRSRDHGNSWTKLDQNSQGTSTWPASAQVNDLAMSPRYGTGGPDETLFAATTVGLYRWDGLTTGWSHVATDWNYNFTRVALPPTYDRTQGASFPFHVVMVATDFASAPGLYLSQNDGGSLYRWSDSDVQQPDITAITMAPGYGVTTFLAFVSRATTGVFFTDQVDGGAPAFWCAINAGLSTLNFRDLAASPVLVTYGADSYVRLVGATDTGPYQCEFRTTNHSYQCLGSWTYAWTASGLFPFPSCTDMRAVAFAQNGDGSVVGVGTAENGVYFSGDGGYYFDRPGTGYRTLPDDVHTLFPYMRTDILDTGRESPVLLASSPTYGVFISRNRGDSFQPYNGPGCTPLNDGAFGLSGGFERLGADPNFAGWTDDVLFAGTACGGVYARRILARYGSSLYYPFYLDFYPWGPANPNPSPPQPLAPFQRITTITNGNIAEPIWASSADRACGGLGEFLCPAATTTEFSAANSGLPNTNATSVRPGTTATPWPQTLPVNGSRTATVAGGAFTYFTVTVPSGQANLSIALHQMSQDVDLYVRYAGLPTLTSFDYRPYLAGTTPEIVDLTPTGSPMPLTPGLWYIGVYGYTGGTTTFTITCSDAVALTTGVGVAGSVAQGAMKRYYIVVPTSGYPHLNLSLTGLSADADLYAKWGSVVSTTNFDFRSTNGGTTADTIDINPTTPGIEFVGAYGYAAGTTNYTLTATLLTSLAEPAWMVPQEGPKTDGLTLGGSLLTDRPDAPAAGVTWGTVSNSGVFRGVDTGYFSGGDAPSAILWSPRNGTAPTALGLGEATQTVIELEDGTLLAGQAGALWQSPAPDAGQTIWYDFSPRLSGTSLDVRDFLQCANGDVLVGVNGSVGSGGVWLSGSQGRYWMNLSSGFDATSQALASLVSTDRLTGQVKYYSGTDSTGAYTRTITPQVYPTVTAIDPATGPGVGGTSVTVTGTGFSNVCPTGTASDCPHSAPLVLFGERAVVATWISATQLTATAPAHGAGTVAVRVVNPDSRMATCVCTFTYTGSDPFDLRVTRPGGTQIHLDWSTSTAATIQRATDPAFTQNVVTVLVTGSTWDDTSGAATDGTTYYYRVL